MNLNDKINQVSTEYEVYSNLCNRYKSLYANENDGVRKVIIFGDIEKEYFFMQSDKQYELQKLLELKKAIDTGDTEKKYCYVTLCNEFIDPLEVEKIVCTDKETSISCVTGVNDVFRKSKKCNKKYSNPIPIICEIDNGELVDIIICQRYVKIDNNSSELVSYKNGYYSVNPRAITRRPAFKILQYIPASVVASTLCNLDDLQIRNYKARLHELGSILSRSYDEYLSSDLQFMGTEKGGGYIRRFVRKDINH